MANRRKFIQGAGALVVCFTIPACSREGDAAANGSATLGNRIVIDAAGTVTLHPGKVELGQGIGTALAQVVADELGIAIGRVQLSDVDTDYSPDESYTFSSISVQQSVPPVRRAAMAGRRHLLKRAAAAIGVPVGELQVSDGEIVYDGKPTGVSYWNLLAGEHAEIAAEDDEPQSASERRAVGQSIERLDIPGKVFGNAGFLQDLRLPGMVHARVVRPPAERATLEEFAPRAVAELPGVLKVVRDGNFVAVIAGREHQARNAAVRLRQSLQWSLPEDLPEQDDVYAWLTSAPAGVETVASREAAVGAASCRDEKSGTNPKIVKAVYQRPYQAHASISPSAAVAVFQDGRLTVWSHAQGMYPLRVAIAHTLGLAIDNVRCVYRQAAGCYGHNGADDAACDAAVLALQMPGKPVRLQWERADEFAWEPYGSAMHIAACAELDNGGTIRRWDYDLWSCAHTSRPRNAENAGNLIYAQHKETPLSIPPPRSIPQPNGGADRNAVPLYTFDSMSVTKHLVKESPIRVSSLRGLGAYANVFAIESFMDELALRAGRDPLAFRLSHLEDSRAIELLERLAGVSSWPERPAPGSGEGWGIGFARFKNLSGYVGVVFEVHVAVDSGVIALKRATAVCDVGLAINPDGVRAQIEGGIVQSASWTIKEELRFSASGIEGRDWAGYPILRFDEVPDVNVHLIQRDNERPLGVGEAAQGPAAAAIANAVFHASGRRLRRLPLTPERFLAAGT